MKPSHIITSSVFIFFLLFPINQAFAQQSYDDLESIIANSDSTDTVSLEQLPPPETPREYWLRARVEPEIERATSYLDEAIDRAENPDERREYLEYWLRLSLLRNPENLSFDRFSDLVDDADVAGTADGELWYLSGQLARTLDRPRFADRYFSRVPESSNHYARALLMRASVLLDMNQNKEANGLLRRYFVSKRTDDRSLYWMIQARYFENTRAESEAYIAYSHVINHYSPSLDRFEAEDRIADLPLPAPLYPNGPREEDRTRSNDRERIRPEDSGKRFGIQVGSFQERSHAEKLRRSLESWVEYNLRITEVTVESQNYYRVQIIDIPTRSRTRKLLEKLKSSGYSGFVITP